ncbi:MAG: 3'(2'),5'-bisphosphate nucleotidase CysQ [Proteobacteria bacterium]|nr:3'(2'),5'-bisphosphate nucleotidase CysQ [Pseudomonadota bacterium]
MGVTFSSQSVSVALLERLTEIVVRAAACIQAMGEDRPPAARKADGSPVTAADHAADAILVQGTQRLLPDWPVISEERIASAAPPRPGQPYILIDPLDGTREFIAGRDEFTINVALMVDSRPLAGIVAAPARGLLYRSVPGAGAQKLRLADGAAADATPIRARRAPAEGLVALVSRSHLDAQSVNFLARLGNPRQIAVGSALKLCWLADGLADFYPRLAPTSAWDIAAGHAILAAAGGSLCNPHGHPLDYTAVAAGDYRVPGFVAFADPTLATRAFTGQAAIESP